MKTLAEYFDAWKISLRSATLEMLTDRAEYIGTIERFGNGNLAVSGISLDVTPWDDQDPVGLSLRLRSEYPGPKFDSDGKCIGSESDSFTMRYNPGEWSHYLFTSGCESPAHDEASRLIIEVIQDESSTHDDQQLSNLVFLAAADALLHASVFESLKQLEIDATDPDEFANGPFDYIVTDPDGSLSANYCDIVKANRAMSQLLT